jgi:hypothetical protein
VVSEARPIFSLRQRKIGQVIIKQFAAAVQWQQVTPDCYRSHQLMLFVCASISDLYRVASATGPVASSPLYEQP